MPLPAFSRASEGLAELSDALASASYQERARRVILVLAEALETARSRHLPLRDAFLMAVSSGGGEDWQGLEGQLVKRLNGSEWFEKWASEHGPQDINDQGRTR